MHGKVTFCIRGKATLCLLYSTKHPCMDQFTNSLMLELVKGQCPRFINPIRSTIHGSDPCEDRTGVRTNSFLYIFIFFIYTRMHARDVEM